MQCSKSMATSSSSSALSYTFAAQICITLLPWQQLIMHLSHATGRASPEAWGITQHAQS